MKETFIYKTFMTRKQCIIFKFPFNKEIFSHKSIFKRRRSAMETFFASEITPLILTIQELGAY